jgi:hypothetical protein
MGKFHITLKTIFGEISIEGDSREEILRLLKDALSLIEDVKSLTPSGITTPTALSALKKELEGIIEVTADDRPQIIISPEKLSAKDVIGLLLYWKYPNGFSMGELTSLVSLSWKAVDQPYVAANIGQMKGLLLREGLRGRYIFKLSGTGKSWVETDLLPRMREEKK